MRATSYMDAAALFQHKMLNARDWIHANPCHSGLTMPPIKVQRFLRALEKNKLIRVCGKDAKGFSLWHCACIDCTREKHK